MKSGRKSLTIFVLALVAFGLAVGTGGATSRAGGGRELFIGGAVEHADNTVTLPLYRGVSSGKDVYFVVLDASDSEQASRYRVNRSNKLRNAGPAAQDVTVDAAGVVHFPATVKFNTGRVVVPGPGGFPPLQATPGAEGEDGYSPLIRLPGGAILNAPHVANASGRAAKVTNLDIPGHTVRYLETNGFQGDRAVRYVSTESSSPVAAALENVTFAPRLDLAPRAGDDSTESARASLAAFVNGQTGAANPQRQGLNSALLDGLDPLNVLAWNPSQGRYSPLWDVFLTAWSPSAVAAGANLRQVDFGHIKNLADDGTVTAPGGSPWAASGFIVNCPIVSRD